MHGTASERFWAKVDKSAECWLWIGLLDRDGYGRFWPEHRKPTRVHRFSYEEAVGPISDGLVIDHLCRVRACVNPAHLEPVTAEENTRRGMRGGQEHCLRGHRLSDPNLVAAKRKKGVRNCLACARAITHVWRYGGDVDSIADAKYQKRSSTPHSRHSILPDVAAHPPARSGDNDAHPADPFTPAGGRPNVRRPAVWNLLQDAIAATLRWAALRALKIR